MEHGGLRRELGWFDGAMVIAGSTIGSGIFITTGFIAQALPSPGVILLVWLLGGLLALAGALSCAELAAALPYAGGDYVYLREAYGPLLGFLSGWSAFLVTFSGSIAFLAVAFTEHAAFFLPFLSRDYVLVSTKVYDASFVLSPAHLFSILWVLMLSAVHYLGVRQGSRLQNCLTILKIAALGGIIALGITLGKGSTEHFSPFFELERVGDLSALGLAFLPVIFTYAGWNAVIYMAGEVRRPEKTLPAALLWANVMIIVLYLAINAVYLYGVPVTQMQGEIRVAELATTALFGHQSSVWVTAMIGLSILGALNVTIMTGPRIYFAMAQNGLFFRRLGEVHPRFHTPANAIVLQGIWSIFLILTGTFETLLTYVSVMIAVFSALTVGAVLVLRWKRPGLARPYRTWGYPWVPSLFILVYGAIAGATFHERPVESLLGAGIVAVGIPAYFWWRNQLKEGITG